jgi:protein-S-isoprenylcysteine O-methyltransferase Ste14
MALIEEFERTGNWLFRWRSYLPIAMVVVILLGIRSMDDQPTGMTHHFIDLFALSFAFAGLGVRVVVIGYKAKKTSGGNVDCQVADVLNTTGMYSLVRHPLYLGNFIIWVGISLVFQTWWMTLLVVLIFWLYYERIAFAEEAFLRKKFGRQYLQWSEHTPAFLPSFKKLKWQQPELTFSWKKVVGKEYAGFMAIILCFTAIEVLIGLIKFRAFSLSPFWSCIFASGLLIYLILRYLKRCTQVLSTPDR